MFDAMFSLPGADDEKEKKSEAGWNKERIHAGAGGLQLNL